MTVGEQRAANLDSQPALGVCKNRGVLRRIWTRIARELLRLMLRPTGRGVIRLGSEYGGWWVPERSLTEGAVAYCVGAGEDITFDLELLNRGLHVTTFDPTPRAIEYVTSLAIENPRFRFEAVGWWDKADTMRFFAPLDPSHVSHSAVNLQRTSDYFVAHVERPTDSAARLGDTQIALVKLDIEGAEIRVIDSMLCDGPRPGALLVEFDQPQPLAGIIRTCRRVCAAGYTVAKVKGWDVSFVRTHIEVAE